MQHTCKDSNSNWVHNNCFEHPKLSSKNTFNTPGRFLAGIAAVCRKIWNQENCRKVWYQYTCTPTSTPVLPLVHLYSHRYICILYTHQCSLQSHSCLVPLHLISQCICTLMVHLHWYICTLICTSALSQYICTFTSIYGPRTGRPALTRLNTCVPSDPLSVFTPISTRSSQQ